MQILKVRCVRANIHECSTVGRVLVIYLHRVTLNRDGTMTLLTLRPPLRQQSYSQYGLASGVLGAIRGKSMRLGLAHYSLTAGLFGSC